MNVDYVNNTKQMAPERFGGCTVSPPSFTDRVS